MIIVRDFRFGRAIILLAGLLFIAGCIPEKKVGSEYLSKRQNITLVIRAPQWIKMVNQSTDSIQYKSELTQREKDSVKFYSSKLLQNVNDSTFISNYISNLREGLEAQGYKTLVASPDDSVFPVRGNAFLINIGQIELDEQNMPIRDETKFKGKIFAADFDLTKIELDFWIDVNKIEDSVAVLPTRRLYDSYNKTDDFEGYFSWDAFAGNMNYNESIEEITPDFIHTIATQLGIDHATRLNEYLLNEYVAFSLPEKQDRVLLGVNPKFGNLFVVSEPSFQDITEK